jgi:hypothetical protein
MEIVLKDIELIYPNIFTKTENPFNDKLSYRTAFKYAGSQLTDAGVVPRGSHFLYNCNSNVPTTILPFSKNEADYYQISEYVSVARNLNMDLDRLFRNMVVDAVIERYDYHYDERSGRGIALKEIYVVPDELRLRIMKDSVDVG